MFIRIKEKNKLNDRKMKRILKRFYNISPTATIDVMHTCMEYLSFLEGSIPRDLTVTAGTIILPATAGQDS